MKRESIDILQNNLDELIKTHNKLIREGKYNEALNVMKNVEVITRQLKEIGLTINIEENKNNDHILDWYSVLKFFVETKQSQLIKLDYSTLDAQNKHRGTGKTTALLRLSNDYSIPILVKNYERERNELRELANKLGLRITVIDIRMLNMAQYRKCDVILIDENTKFDFNADSQRGRENILNNRVVIGFRNNL